MIYIPELHHRRTSRLRDYDYRQNGAYFVTICIKYKECIFGDIVDGKMRLNEYGRIVEKEWLRMQIARPQVELDEYVIMPNHFHGILWLINGGRGTARRAPTNRQFGKSIADSLSSVIGSFKSAVTKQINLLRNTHGIPVWQRNFYDHIIRNENELNEIRQYIVNNPLKWELDNENPERSN